MRPPAWADVERRAYEPWPGAQLRLDTAVLATEEAAEAVCEAARRMTA
jgi:2-C-methyl-D-erythritol 4-phosphate cytidylyltransferase